MGEHSGVQQSEKVPLGASFGLEVPEYPAIGEALIDIQLRLDKLSRVILEGLIPRVDEIDTAARTMVCAARVVSFVAGTNAVAVERRGAIGHCSGPFANDDPVVNIGGVCTRVAASELAVLSR